MTGKNKLFWDASALVKRYTVEPGSAMVDEAFDHSEQFGFVTTMVAAAETFSILIRKRNDARISDATFEGAATELYGDIINGSAFALFTVSDDTILASFDLIRKHNLNATDAAMLEIAIRVFRGGSSDRWILVASDKRLLRAAQAEDLAVLDPEAATTATLAEMLSR